MFDPLVIESIQRDAIDRYPHESCGVVIRTDVGTLVYRGVDNDAVDPTKSFHFDERILLGLGDRAVAVVHSHPDGPDYPSQRDMEQQLAINLPFGIVSTDGVGALQPFFWGEGVPTPPLIGRGFRHGVTDCYALIRDHFREELGVTLREYPREWGWWLGGQSLYATFFEAEGFYRISESEVREHDCFLAQIRSETPNHAGVYVGKNLVLHHLTANAGADSSRVSRRDPVNNWRKFICGFWVRHESRNA